jgi:CDP-diacylglycerol--serine O-phosphatidyltransferase
MMPPAVRSAERSGREEPAKPRSRLRDLRHVPVLPSLITLGNVFFGFLAMAKVADAALASSNPPAIQSVLPTFEIAALLVFVAMVFDAIDGTVARLTHQTSKFGTQLDSLADMVTFGAAPAFILKVLLEFAARSQPQLIPLHPKLFYGAAVIYVLCAAMRLARFNAETPSASVEDHREFKGLPSPAAAAVICALVTFFCATPDEHDLSRRILPGAVYENLLLAMPIALTLVGLLMVSRFPYPHLVNSIFRRRHSFPFLATLVVLVVVAAVEWQLALLVLAGAYVCSGIVLGGYRLITTGTMSPPPGDAWGFEAEAGDGEDVEGRRSRAGLN